MVYQQRQLLVITLILIILLTPIVFPACPQLKEKVEAMKPEIRSITLDWGKVTPETTEVIGIIKAYNPNPFTLPIKKVTCNINIAGVDLATAETVDLKIEKQAEFPIKILAKIDNRKIPQFWTNHLRNNEKSKALIDIKTTFDLLVTEFNFPYQLKVPIETNLLAQLKQIKPITIEKKAELPKLPLIPVIPPAAVFKVTIDSLSGKWGSITPDTTELILFATIHNQNPYPLLVPKVAYNIKMNDIPLAYGEASANYLFAPNSKNNIITKVDLKTGVMDKWFISHIKQGEKSTFYIKVTLVFEPPMLGKVTVDVWDTNVDFKTNIMPQTIKF